LDAALFHLTVAKGKDLQQSQRFLMFLFSTFGGAV